jgi:hypothetical protein
MRSVLLACLFACVACAQERWIQFRSGPFEVLTNAGAHPGRELLGRFDEFHFALGQILGNPDLQTPLPIRILLFKTATERDAYPTTPAVLDGRDRSVILLAAGAGIPAQIYGECTRLLLESNTARMPAAYENGLIELFSTIDVRGTRIMLGAPPSNPAARTRDWARMQLLATGVDYYGKLRVLLFNLQKGIDEAPAYQNTFGISHAEIEKQVDAYFAAGNFQAAPVSGRPLNADRDFKETPVGPEATRLALADLLLDSRSTRGYQELIAQHAYAAEANEGLGLMALSEKNPEAARRYFGEAVTLGILSQRSYLEYARLEPDSAKAVAALQQAAALSSKASKVKLAPLYSLMAQRETDPGKRLQYLKQAADLAPRDAEVWQALAEGYIERKNFVEAAKAWHSAEVAASTNEQRLRMAKGRAAVEAQRLDAEAAERQRIAAEEAARTEKLKAEARVSLRAAEAKANQKNASSEPKPAKVEAWWEGPKPDGRATGILKRMECTGKMARLVIEGDDHKLIRLVLRDPSKVVILGGGTETLPCGPQKPRRVAIEYFAKPDPKSTAIGEVASIEFQ